MKTADFEKLHREVLDEIKLDQSELDYEALRTHELYLKYLKLYEQEKNVLSMRENEHNIAYRKAYRYWGGKTDEPPAEYVEKSEMKTYILGDDDYIKVKTRYDFQKTVVDYLEKLLKQISDRQWQIRNANDFLKFKNGG